ncbi:pfh1, partial [Symbiodinium natans]
TPGAAPPDFRIVKMKGDGNCLFHALSLHEGGDAAALREELAEFLEERSAEQDEEEEIWLEEAAILRGDPAHCWGGDTSVLAWSLLRQRRVNVHWQDEDGKFHSSCRTHWRVAEDLEAEDFSAVHLLYNGVDHYDLLTATPSNQMPSQSPQERLTEESGGAHSSALGGQPASKSQPKPVPEKGANEEQGGVLEELSLCQIAAESSHPHRPLEDGLRKLAGELRDFPTLPPGASVHSLDAGEAWPHVFCAFQECTWSCERGGERELTQHLRHSHLSQLEPLLKLLPDPNAKDAFLSIYNQAVAIRCRAQAPLAGCSLDRKALQSFSAATARDGVEALVCFCCACIHTRVAETEEKGNIRWRRPLQQDAARPEAPPTFLGRQLPEVLDILGLDSFLEKYDRLEGDLKLTTFEDFTRWRVQLPDGAFLLCCPEDHRCSRHPEHATEGCLCEHCEVPICSECHENLAAGRLPPLSLANDMWTGYAPERLYTDKVTVMEMICASPCITTLVRMSMEARYRSESSPLDEHAHMARHRLGARGNALTFPLPWEDLLRNLQAHHGVLESEAGGEAPAQLPRSGPELGNVVRVVLKTNKTAKTSDAEIKSLIHQANVRREVVVQLILDMKKLGHPAYQGADEVAVRQAALSLPEDGVPPEVLKVIAEIDDKAEDRLQPQKAATPSDAFLQLEEAGAIFAAQRARAVVPEGWSVDRQDQNAAGVLALNELAEQLREAEDPGLHQSPETREEAAPRDKVAQTFEVRTGNKFIDQFQPMYFATAFCFCFKHATACPDIQKTNAAQDSNAAGAATRRRSRDAKAPEVFIYDWAAAMLRRVETQFRRDWTFGFTVWNYIFRTMINLQKNTYMYTIPDERGGRRPLTNEDILKGVCEIQQKLCRGKYKDVTGEMKAIKGDLSKVRYAPNLSEAAKKVLDNCEARTRRIPGTHEVRQTMRHQTHAYRVCYGTSLFLTFSPSERDTTLMLRLARARRSDPAIAQEGSKKFQARDEPDLEVEFCRLDPEALAAELPPYDERRAMLARDPLACLEGFKTLVQLALRHLLGVRFCPCCPDCVTSDTPCVDAFGSSAMACGGIFGRVDAVFGSLETQKNGAFHGHFQVFVQNFHQFTPLADMLKLSTGDKRALLQKYMAYAGHVRRSVYSDPAAWKQKRHSIEAEWPEYRKSTLVLSRPSYQKDAALEGEQWRRAFLEEDVEALQQHKQHHVHLPKALQQKQAAYTAQALRAKATSVEAEWLERKAEERETAFLATDAERLPLAHCRDPRDPTKCKAGFPKPQEQMTDAAVLVCEGLAKHMGLPVKGKRSALGALWGPVNDPNLNGTHPALLAALRCNSDVQVPYRFPILAELHEDDLCQEDCAAGADPRQVVKQAQQNQAAQAGYGCDYMNKRLAIAVQETKEWQKAQTELAKELEGKPTGYAMGRHSKRLATDCCARGVCRASVECVNLVDHARSTDCTRAESIKTAQVTDIALAYGLRLLDAAVAREPLPTEPRRIQTDSRHTGFYGKKKCAECPPWTLYGERGRDPRVHELCAFEFARHYHYKLASQPFSVAREVQEPEKYHVFLTQAGKAKLRIGVAITKLLAGLDYQIKERGGVDWLPLGHGERAQPYRHDWIVELRKRPHVPVIYGAQGCRTEEEQAQKVMLLFCPWTTNAADATDAVPFISDLRGGADSWRDALKLWFARRGFATETLRHYILNFCFVYCLPRELQSNGELAANSDNEGIEDPVSRNSFVSFMFVSINEPLL